MRFEVKGYIEVDANDERDAYEKACSIADRATVDGQVVFTVETDAVYPVDEPEDEEGDLYARLARSGAAYARITYHGSGDEGWVEDVTFDPSDAGSDALIQELKDHAYDVLERKFPGWEINEGSDGHIAINVVERSTNLHHGTHIETTEYEDVAV